MYDQASERKIINALSTVMSAGFTAYGNTNIKAGHEKYGTPVIWTYALVRV